MRKEPQMDMNEAVDRLEQRAVAAVNESGLPPVVVRLVLLNILHAVEDQQREQKKGESTDG